MNRKFVSRVILPILIIVELSFLFLTWMSYSNKDITEIKEENKVNKEMFSMYVENDEGKYEEYKDGETFTIAGYKLNISKSNCVDNKGKLVPDIILSTNNKVTINSNKTVFCYLYFDKDRSVYGKVVSDYANGNGVSKVSTTSAETGNTYDAYYYTGNITNNNILYGGFCWKMVITTETNGVKLIYNGIPTTGTDTEGNTTYSCDNTGTASQLSSTKAFNSSRTSPAYVGYMYNSVYNVVSTSDATSMKLTTSATVLTSQGSMTSSSRKYYFGDSVTYSNGTYTLNNAQQYDWSSSYSSMVGKYTCRITNSTTGSSCSTVYYVAATTSTIMYYYDISGGNEYSDYNLKLATSITDNGDGTHTLNSPVEVTRSDYYSNSSTYKNYYFCSDLTSETCSDMYYSYSSSSTSLSHVYVAKNYKYGNSFTYDSSTGTYTLIDTEVSSIKQFWNWYTNYNTLSNNHYTCFNTNGTCTSLYYINYTSSTNAHYITLTGGKSVSDAINEMLYAEDVNKTDSTIKAYIDTWYEDSILGVTDGNGVLYSKYLENAIFCNNRANTGLGPWNPDGGSTTSIMDFNYNSLECENKTDRFTLKTSMGGTEEYGNNALDYPIGLISYKEAGLASPNGYLKSGSNYWLLSPYRFSNNNAYGNDVYSGGALDYNYVTKSCGVRPAVSLSTSVDIESGDGSVTSPYQVELNS